MIWVFCKLLILYCFSGWLIDNLRIYPRLYFSIFYSHKTSKQSMNIKKGRRSRCVISFTAPICILTEWKTLWHNGDKSYPIPLYVQHEVLFLSRHDFLCRKPNLSPFIRASKLSAYFILGLILFWRRDSVWKHVE